MIGRICSMSNSLSLPFLKIELPAHPEFGLDHLKGRFGSSIIPSKSRGLSVAVDNRILDRPFENAARDRVNGRQLPKSHAFAR